MKTLKNILSKSSNFHSLNDILKESLRIGINDIPENEYSIEDFVDNTVFTFTFWVRSNGEIRITFNWVIISDLEMQPEGNYPKAKLSAYNQNANVMASYLNSPITFINPDNAFIAIAMFRRDKIFNNNIDSTIFFNPKYNNVAVNFLKNLLKSKTPGFGKITIGDVLDVMGIDGSDYEQFIGKDYDLEGEIHTKKVILRDIISHLGIVKESLRISINDKPEEIYNFDNISEAYILSFYYGPNDFYIEKYDIEKIKRIDNKDQIGYKITAYNSAKFGFSNVDFKYIEDCNILYSSTNKRTNAYIVHIIIHPEDKKLLNNLIKLTNKIKKESKYTISTILNNLKIDNNFYEDNLSVKMTCDMDNWQIANLQSDLESTYTNLNR